MIKTKSGQVKSHSDVYGDKIFNSIVECQTISQFEGILRMIELFENRFKCKFPYNLSNNKYYKAIKEIR